MRREAKVSTAAIIEARMTSTRLPGKILLPVLGRPLLDHLIERLRRARTLDQIIVATTMNATDDPVEALARDLGCRCFRGSEDDVLERVLSAAHRFGVDLIAEITGDCPLMDPAVVDRVIRTFQEGSCDYASNVLRRTYPRGMDVQVFTTKILERASQLTRDPIDREHVSLFIYEHPELFRLCSVESGLPSRWWDLRLTVDTIEDFTLVSSIFEELYPANPGFGLSEILELLKTRPDLVEMNREIQQKKVR